MVLNLQHNLLQTLWKFVGIHLCLQCCISHILHLTSNLSSDTVREILCNSRSILVYIPCQVNTCLVSILLLLELCLIDCSHLEDPLISLVVHIPSYWMIALTLSTVNTYVVSINHLERQYVWVTFVKIELKAIALLLRCCIVTACLTILLSNILTCNSILESVTTAA